MHEAESRGGKGTRRKEGPTLNIKPDGSGGISRGILLCFAGISFFAT
jgi:hypothetical protein